MKTGESKLGLKPQKKTKPERRFDKRNKCYSPNETEMLAEMLFSRNVKPGIFGLGIAPKETFLGGYSTQFVFLIIRLVPGKVVMVAIDMCGISPIMGEWIYGITSNHVYRL